jgi:hypothetical protein
MVLIQRLKKGGRMNARQAPGERGLGGVHGGDIEVGGAQAGAVGQRHDLADTCEVEGCDSAAGIECHVLAEYLLGGETVQRFECGAGQRTEHDHVFGRIEVFDVVGRACSRVVEERVEVKPVGPLAAIERVGTRPARENVVTVPAGQLIVAGSAYQRVITRAAEQGIGAVGACQRVHPVGTVLRRGEAVDEHGDRRRRAAVPGYDGE